MSSSNLVSMRGAQIDKPRHGWHATWMHLPVMEATRTTSQLRSALRGVGMLAFTAGFTEAGLLRLRCSREEERPGVVTDWVRSWATRMLTLFGVEQHWASHLPAAAQKARLVVANHRSPLDILLMLEHFGGSVLARHDLESWPVMGRGARAAGTIFVNRDDARSGARAIREMRRRLRAGKTVVAFPEGTTHEGDCVHPFLGGAFSAVRGLDVELVPVGIAYEPGTEFVEASFVEHLQRVAQRRRTHVALCLGEALPPDCEHDRVADLLRDRVQALVSRSRSALDGTG